jgi:hypothetical protein
MLVAMPRRPSTRRAPTPAAKRSSLARPALAPVKSTSTEGAYSVDSVRRSAPLPSATLSSAPGLNARIVSEIGTEKSLVPASSMRTEWGAGARGKGGALRARWGSGRGSGSGLGLGSGSGSAEAGTSGNREITARTLTKWARRAQSRAAS